MLLNSASTIKDILVEEPNDLSEYAESIPCGGEVFGKDEQMNSKIWKTDKDMETKRKDDVTVKVTKSGRSVKIPLKFKNTLYLHFLRV